MLEISFDWILGNGFFFQFFIFIFFYIRRCSFCCPMHRLGTGGAKAINFVCSERQWIKKTVTCILEILCTYRKYSLVLLYNLFTWSCWHPEFAYLCTYPATCYKVSVVSHSLLCTLSMHCTLDVKSDLALCLCCTYFAPIWMTDRTAMQKGMRPLFLVCVHSSGFFQALWKCIFKSKSTEITWKKNVFENKLVM